MNVFVAGVHGVGKSTLCSAYAEAQKEDWVHRSASDLIRQELGRQNWSIDKRVDSVETNQQLLIRGVKNSNLNNRRLLLDGHFILQGANHRFVPVPDEVFKELDLSGVVLIEAEPHLVLSRLRGRDVADALVEEVAALMKTERVQGENVCARLRLPLRVAVQPSLQEFSEIIDSLRE